MPTEVGTTNAKRPSPVRVLVVEPSLTWRNVVTRALTHKFPEVAIREVVNGEQALRAVVWRPNLVICDLHLPGIDGYEMLRRLRSISTMRDVPVLVTCEPVSSAAAIRLVKMRIDGFMIKPYAIDRLVSRVERMLTRSAGPVDTRPRNAIRRRIGERVIVYQPIKLLTPKEICVPVKSAAPAGTELECDFTDISQMMRFRPPDNPVNCVIKGFARIKGEILLRLQMLDPVKGLAEAIDKRIWPDRTYEDGLFPSFIMPRIGIPAQTVDLSALGMRVNAPVDFEGGTLLKMSVARLTRPLFSQCRETDVLCKVSRSKPLRYRYEMGLRFEEAPAEFISDVLHWSAAAE